MMHTDDTEGRERELDKAVDVLGRGARTGQSVRLKCG